MQPGDLVSGKYRLLRQLGRGGMGSVWAARNELTDRDFAIKFLHPELAQTKESLHRFFLEARACGQIKHPAVVAVYDMGQAEDGTPYLVMELMEGEGLDHRLARSNLFRPGEAAAFVAFIARGLEEAHVRGLVHRDLKPGNIFFALDDRGEVVPKVLDFGVTKATQNADPKFVRTNTGAVLGSPAYMSPEQARGDEDIDGRSDVWSLGVILYECLTGKIPFDGPNYNALMVSILMNPHVPAKVVNPEIPDEVSEVIEMTLQKDRNRRVGTARELAERLEGMATRITGTPYPGTVRHRSFAPPPRLPKDLMDAHSETTPTTSVLRSAGVEFGEHRARRVAWISAAVFSVAIVAIAIVFLARQRAPEVAVAARAANVLDQSETQLEEDLARVKREAARTRLAPEPQLPAPAPSAKRSIEIDPEDLPDLPRPTGSALPRPSASAPDKHGGVKNPGF
ncbi:MAG: serine/threonine-protein kinase [Polyangiaceae bacterium]